MGAGDGHTWNHTMSSIDGYQFYNHALSTDGGVSFTIEAPPHDMGSARPKLLSLGNLIMLGGGRNRAENTNDILLWSSSSSSFSSRGGWREHSISYWHNRLAATAGVSKFTAEVNSTSEPVYCIMHVRAIDRLTLLHGGGAPPACAASVRACALPSPAMYSISLHPC